VRGGSIVKEGEQYHSLEPSVAKLKPDFSRSRATQLHDRVQPHHSSGPPAPTKPKPLKDSDFIPQADHMQFQIDLRENDIQSLRRELLTMRSHVASLVSKNDHISAKISQQVKSHAPSVIPSPPPSSRSASRPSSTGGKIRANKYKQTAMPLNDGAEATVSVDGGSSIRASQDIPEKLADPVFPASRAIFHPSVQAKMDAAVKVKVSPTKLPQLIRTPSSTSKTLPVRGRPINRGISLSDGDLIEMTALPPIESTSSSSSHELGPRHVVKRILERKRQ
jgi:hypothetical protein